MLYLLKQILDSRRHGWVQAAEKQFTLDLPKAVLCAGHSEKYNKWILALS